MNGTETIQGLLLPELENIEAYSAGMTLPELSKKYGIPESEFINLRTNENPFGMPPGAKSALSRNMEHNRYPDLLSRNLRNALAVYTGVDAEQIVPGAGSDEIIHILTMMFLGRGDAIVTCEPTFSMYWEYAMQYGAEVINVPRDENFEIDTQKVLNSITANTKIVYLCSPNSPTGNELPEETLVRVLQTGKLVVVDEAYYEFCNQTYVPLMQDWPNLVILRTMSKFFGLAGLRIGYGLFPSYLAKEAWKVVPPYNVNSAAQIAALAALESDLPWLREKRDIIVQERERIAGAFNALTGFTAFPSRGNFFLVRISPPLHAKDFAAKLLPKGVIVRSYSSDDLKDCLRISIGTPAENNKLLESLNEVLER